METIHKYYVIYDVEINGVAYPIKYYFELADNNPHKLRNVKLYVRDELTGKVVLIEENRKVSFGDVVMERWEAIKMIRIKMEQLRQG